ncbi:MAG TPA: AAA family ATPase, partial [Candidatus Saccharimonadia bacterium]|nr:AAA family ATPase [Candidatus Saccharimonadia bacterium]
MFLSRVTVTGFKSFASTTVLNLEPGVTAVVGPNGSGKSNLADAIRWALGEQSKGRLRLGGRDEVVFAGTEKKAKASFAQVVLLFNNEDGAMPLDLTEVEVSRRVYRSGESDYRLAGRSVRLSDIQALMVQAGFGVGTYAVIGQGMIDSFLMSPPAERKLLFDEAVGIRGPEQGREAALRKLESTNQNLVRLRDIAAELSPRLHSLQGVVDASSVTRGLEEAITGLRTSLARGKIAHWAGRQKELEKSKVSLSTQIDELRRELGDTEQKLAALSAKDEAHRAESERVQLELSRLESTRDQLGIELNKARGALAEANRSKELISQFNAELKKSRLEQTSARDRMKELETEFASNSEAAERALQAVERAGRLVADAQVALVDLRHSASDSSRDQYVDHALQILRTLATTLSGEEVELEQIRLLVHKAGRLLSHAGKVNATELLNELKAAQKKLETAMVKRETAVEHQTNVTITIRSLEIDLVHGRQAVERTDAEVERIAAKIEPLEKVAADLDHLKTLETNCASQAVNASAELEQLRQRSRELTVAFADAGRRSEHVAALERGKLMLANAERTYAGVEPELTAAKEAQVLAQSEAVEWQVNSDGPLSADTLDDLQSKLVLA